MPTRRSSSLALSLFGLVGLVVVVGLLACDGSSPRRLAPSGECSLADRLRGRTGALLDAGKLDRTLRFLDRADELCPESARDSTLPRIEALNGLGRHAEVVAVADSLEEDRHASPAIVAAVRAARAQARELAREAETRIDKSSPSAWKRGGALLEEASVALDAGDWATAEEKYLAAWRERRPYGQALLGAGLAAKRRGDEAGAQRLFDRAIFELEKKLDARVALEIPNGLPSVATIAWSPNGKRIAVAAYTYVSVLDATTLRETMRFTLADAKPRAVSWSPDGKTLATCSEVGARLHLWDIDSGDERRLFAKRSPGAHEGVNDACRSLAWSPDGRRLATPMGDAVELWDVASGQATATLALRSGQALSVAWSPDGATIALGSTEGVSLWDVGSRTWVKQLGPPKGSVVTVAWSPDGKSLASGGNGDFAVHVWDARSGQQRHALKGHNEELKAVAWSPDGKILASNSADATVRLWDVALGEEMRKIILDGTTEAFLYTLSVAWSPDGKTFAAGDMFGTLSLWTLDSGKPRTMRRHQDPIASVAWSPDGKSVAIGSRSWTTVFSTGRIWDLASGKQTPLEGVSRSGELRWSPDGKTIASYGGDGIALWEAPSGKALKKLGADGAGEVRSVAWSPDGKTLAAGYAEATVRLWDVSSGDEIRKLSHKRASFDSVDTIAWSPDGKTIVGACAYESVCLWDAASGASLPGIDLVGLRVPKELAWSPDGKTIAAAGFDGPVAFLDAASGKQQKTMGERCSPAIAWSADSRRLAAACRNALCFWDVASGEAVDAPAVDSGGLGIGTLAWSPDGTTIAAGGSNGMVRFWNLARVGERDAGVGAGKGEDPESVAACPIRGGTAAYVSTLGADPRFELLGNGARDLAYCRIGSWSFPVELCEERFVVPGLLRRVMGGDTSFREP